MALEHALSGEVLDIRPLGSELANEKSKTLVRAPHLEVFRMVLLAGKRTPMHKAAGTITIQCLEGEVILEAHGSQQRMRAGDLVYLDDAEPHAVEGVTDASLLITILLNRV